MKNEVRKMKDGNYIYNNNVLVSIVCDDALDMIADNTITINKRNGYAYIWDKATKQQTSLHQFLIGKQDGLVIDHINGNRIDNQLINLQHISQKDNCRKRNVSNFSDEQKAKNAEYQKQYYYKNKEKKAKIMKDYYLQKKFKKIWLSLPTEKTSKLA